MVVQTFFPDEREILKESELSSEEIHVSKSLRKEIMLLNKLGLEDSEIKYLIYMKSRQTKS